MVIGPIKYIMSCEPSESDPSLGSVSRFGDSRQGIWRSRWGCSASHHGAETKEGDQSKWDISEPEWTPSRSVKPNVSKLPCGSKQNNTLNEIETKGLKGQIHQNQIRS